MIDILIAATAAGSLLCLFIAAFWDFRDLGHQTHGTSQRRGSRGDPWWNPPGR